MKENNTIIEERVNSMIQADKKLEFVWNNGSLEFKREVLELEFNQRGRG